MFATEVGDLVDPRAWEEDGDEGGSKGGVMSKEEREREGLRVLEGDVVGEKRGMVGMRREGGGMKVGVGEGVREALEGLKGEGEGGRALVMLVCMLSSPTPVSCPLFGGGEAKSDADAKGG